MGSALPLNEGNEEISLSRLGGKRVSSTENLENGDFQKFDDDEWFDGGESLKKNPVSPEEFRCAFILTSHWRTRPGFSCYK